MPRPILDLTPFPGATFTDVDEGRDTFLEDGPGQERTLRAGGVACRVYTWPHGGYPEAEEAVRAFQAARLLAGESFYVTDPWSSARVDVDVGPAVGAQSVLELPNDDEVEEYRDFPVDDLGVVVAKVNGVEVDVASVDTDARTITLAAPAADGDEVLVSYRAYRLCRFAPTVRWTADEPDWYVGNLELREVLRDP